MASIHKEYSTFVKGIITEANPLTFPENASTDEANFVLNMDGSRQRRFGIDYEAGYSLSEDILEDFFSDSAITTYTWKNIRGLSSANLVIVQVGNLLHLYDSDNSSISANENSETIDLSAYELDGKRAEDREVSMSEVSGRLIVCSEFIEPFYVAYDKNNNTFFTEKIQILIRDFIGLESGLLIEENPTTLSQEHNYNLQNQGWTTGNISNYFTAISKYPSDAQQWVLGKDASDNFVASLLTKQDFGNTPAPKGKYTLDLFNREYNTATGTTTSTAISSASYDRILRELTITSSTNHGLVTGDTTLIKGLEYYSYGEDSEAYRLVSTITQRLNVEVVSSKIFKCSYYIPYYRDVFGYPAYLHKGTYSAYGAVATRVKVDTESSRVTTVASLAGRAFYAGMTDSDYSNYIFFTRIIQNITDINKCYQEADPTSEEISDLVESDGGFVVIAEAAKIIKLVSIEDSILVFATNGVWQIKGGETLGFTAIDYSVSKVTSVGTINIDSIVIVENSVIYWAEGGIYTLSPDNISGKLNAQNLSETTIQSLYLNIPSISRTYATGTYDQDTKRVSWLYNDSIDYDGIAYKYNYTKELIFDVSLSAFFKNEFGELASLSPYVSGYVKTSGLVTTNTLYDVVVGTDPVLVGADPVQIAINLLGRGSLGIKYLTVVPKTGGLYSNLTFSEYTNLDFVDWETNNGVGIDAGSYLDTGAELLGDTTRDKQAKYLTMHFIRTENGFVQNAGLDASRPSSCLVQSKWGWSNSSTSGKWGTQFQAYKLNRNYIPTGVSDDFDYGFEVISTKNKLRGVGKALSLRIDSEEGKDMYLLGWGIDYTGRRNT